MNLNDKIHKTLDVILENVKHKDLSTFWPVPLPDVEPCYVDLFALDLLEFMKEVRAKHIDSKVLAEQFLYPSKFWNIIWNILVGSKVANFPFDDRMFPLQKVYEILEEMKPGSIFNDNYENLILSPQEAQNMVDTTTWIETKTLNRFVSELNSFLLGFCESLFFIYHKDGLEKHGPYQVQFHGKKGKLVVRDGYFLRPVELWPEVIPFPFNSIITRVIYHEDTRIGFDIFNNPIIQESLSDKIIAFNVIVKAERNRELVSESGLEDLVQELENYITTVNQKIEGWTLHDKAKRHIEISWHTLRPGFTLLGKGWRTERMNEALARVDRGCIQHHEGGGDLRSFLDPRM